MSEFENNSQLPVQSEIVEFAEPSDSSEASVSDLLMPILRRWYIVLLVFLLIVPPGIAAIWFLVTKKYDTQASIRVSTVVPHIMYETGERLAPYDTFKNTQAVLISGDIVLNRAADEIKDKNLIFFQNENQNIVQTLHKMITNGAIEILPDRFNEFIHLEMTTEYPSDAEVLLDALVRGYMSIVTSEENKDDNEKLSVLDQRRRMLEDQMEQQRLKIRQRVEEYGTGLTSRQEIMLEQLATLQNELVSIAIQRIMLETRVTMKEKQLSSDYPFHEFNDRRNELVESDPLIRSLFQDVQQYEVLVREGQINMKDTNPELIRRKDMLTDLRRQLEKRRAEVRAQVDEQLEKEISRTRSGELDELKAELEQTVQYENRLRETMEKLDTETKGIGRTQFEIDDYREQFDQTNQIYNELCRRIEEITIERSRQPRITVGSYARSIEAKGKRRKMAMAVTFAGFAAGVGLAWLLGRFDKSLRVPDEVVKRIGVRVIGTTTSPRDIDRKMLPQQLMDDYQTIRANISLLDDAENSEILVVTSPGIGDGKTTFSVNLATSFAQAGQRTLLIDGDLRKPDISLVLKMPADQRGLQDYLFGADHEHAAYKVDGLNLYVLAADSRNNLDALEMLSSHETARRIRSLRQYYDKIIIDTPPVLAFADTLMWARMSDGVVLTSFVGHTSKTEIREAIRRLNEINVRILGTVVNNVKMSSSYRRYGYGYGYRYGKDAEKKRNAHRKNGNTLLISVGPISQEHLGGNAFEG